MTQALAQLRLVSGWHARAVATLVACALLVVTAEPAAAGLAERLAAGETITLVAFGDSLATGYELQHPTRDSYPYLFAAAIQRRYPTARVRVVIAGIPGDTAAGGARRVARDVLAHAPDLVTVQFGGNDHGAHHSPEAFRADLTAIVTRIRAASAAPLLLATPPIVSAHDDTPMVKVVKEVARTAGIPLADFDGAIRRLNPGPRGPFPLDRHPGIHLHAVMARSLYQAFAPLLGEAPEMTLAIQAGARDLLADEPVPVEVHARVPAPGPVTLFLEEGETRHQTRVEADADGLAVATFTLPAVKPAPGGERRRLLAWAHAGAGFAYDVRWLTAAPVAVPGIVQEIEPRGLVLAPQQWRGPDDLSARFRVEMEERQARFVFTVRDSQVRRNRTSPWASESDCVELYLDLRPRDRLGHPFWEEGVVALLLRPGTENDTVASWSTLDGLPNGWEPPAITSWAIPGGYQIELRLPQTRLRERLVPGQESIGLDVAVDDADDRRGRKCQMAWAGGADTFLDPSLFGALALQPFADGRPRVRVTIR